VECSPNGRNAARAPICVAKDIKSYPTWFIRGQRYTGVLDLERLARLSGYTPPEGVKP